jgi:hypothetical protein
VGAGGEMNQALYAHMNNKRKGEKKSIIDFSSFTLQKNFTLFLFC